MELPSASCQAQYLYMCVTGAVFVKCFITDERAELDSDCQPPETNLPVTALPTTTTATASRTTVVTFTAAGSSPPLAITIDHAVDPRALRKVFFLSTFSR